MIDEIRYFLSTLPCRIGRHKPHRWEGGHVYAGDDWDGPRMSDGTPWAPSFTSCDRCGAKL